MSKGAQFIADVQLYDKYARWIPEENRRETWGEVVKRVMNFFITSLGKQNRTLPSDVWDGLSRAMLAKEIMPSMRVVQMAGPALERCHVGAYNCAYLELDSPEALGELLYILMQGTGVGYSVERESLTDWPVVSPVETEMALELVVSIEDTTEAWCKAFVQCILYAHLGMKIRWDYSRIRPEGAWLHTKGGRASGPEPLRQLLDKTYEIVRGASGRSLSPFEVHRLATMCGSIVQVGGVRRAAEIALFDADDAEMAGCKQGNFWELYPELAMANNSMVFTGPPSGETIRMFVSELAAHGTGEPGLFRRDGAVPTRRKIERFGTNPCGEIILRSRQFCNLSVAVARPDDTHATLSNKVNMAALLGTIQSCLTDFTYLSPQWKQNCEEERLLGVDITGAMDCAYLHPSVIDNKDRLQRLRDAAVYSNRFWAAVLGINPSAAVTCNKPSGNSSQFLGTASGIHPRYAPYYVRRLRIGARSPLGEHLKSFGIPVFPEVGQGTIDTARVWVFEFPIQSPEGAVCRKNITAAEQMEYWLAWKQLWTEHNPSCTIYVEPHEWPDVEAFLLTHWESIGGLSFLPKDGGIYALAPYEEITEQEYFRRVANLPDSLNLELIREQVDNTTMAQDYACVGGLCEL